MKQETIFGAEQDAHFMRKALRQAQLAFKHDEIPVGAVIVNCQGEIIARGINKVEQRHTQTAHAECLAIERAGKVLGDWRLEGCWLYVTLEPCGMCMNLILLSRLAGVVFGASSPLFGFHLDTTLSVALYQKKTLAIVGGIHEKEAGELLKQFFKMRRKKKE